MKGGCWVLLEDTSVVGCGWKIGVLLEDRRIGRKSCGRRRWGRRRFDGKVL